VSAGKGLLKRIFKLGDSFSANQSALQFQDANGARFLDIQVHDTYLSSEISLYIES
jgi:hypothetical protein